MSDAETTVLTVLGIGNILMRDEGVGVHLLRALQEVRTWPADVEFVDGGVGGLNLLLVIERARRMIVLDAAEMHLAPGEFRVIRPEQLAEQDAAGRLSLHEMPFLETLALCERFSRRPAEVAIFAIQPGTIEHGLTMSEALSAAMPRLAAAAGELIAAKISPGPELM